MIIFIHHSVNPYRVAFFTALHKRKVPFKVYFLSSPAANRKWKKDDFELVFPHTFLSGWKLTIPGNDHSYFQVNTDVWRALQKDQPSIVISIGWNYLATFIAAIWTRKYLRRFVVWSESTSYEQSVQRSLTKPLIKLLLASCWKCIAAGTRASEYLQSLGVKPEKIHIAYYTVDTKSLSQKAASLQKNRESLRATLGLQKKDIAVLFVGQFIPRKGISQLLEAAESLKKKSIIKFVFVGYGELITNIKNAAKNNDALLVFSYAKPENIMEYFVAADIFVLPSIEETWGLVVNEAQCAQLSVLVSQRAGSSADLVIEGKTGFTFDPYDSNSLTSLISQLAHNKKQRVELGVAGYDRIQHINLEQNCSVIEEIYNSFITTT